ncbi:Nucleotidylyl transferase, partial [Hanseniaspora valbyensis NRRL Y-1626]
MSVGTLTINFKSPVVKYNDLILARYINLSKEGSLDIAVVDDKSIKFQSELKLASGTTLLDNDVFVELAKFTEQKELDLDLYKLSNEKLTLKKFDVLNEELLKLNSLLDLRTYIKDTVEFGLEDILVWGILRSNGLMGSILKNKNYINLTRWYNHMELYPVLGESHQFIQQECKNLKTSQKLKNAAEGKKKEGHKANFDIDLPGAKIGEVVTRFPPEPSGYLHIGHAKAALLNQYFANQFKGKLLIRFDDTNPSKEKEEYEQSIIEDLALMEIKGDALSYTSDHFDLIYDYALQMIKEGKAYCDDTDVETMREERGEGIKSKRRDRSVEENLRIFTEEM